MLTGLDFGSLFRMFSYSYRRAKMKDERRVSSDLAGALIIAGMKRSVGQPEIEILDLFLALPRKLKETSKTRS